MVVAIPSSKNNFLMPKSYKSLSEKKLVSLSRHKNEKAFEELFFRNKEAIFGWICSTCRNERDAEEYLQITLIKCWKNIEKFKSNSSFRTWANRIAMNLFRDEYRKKKRQKTDSLEEFSKDTSFIESRMPTTENEGQKRLVAKELKDDIDKMFEGMSKKHCKILKMFLVDEMTYREIAEEMECPLGTVMSRLFYARKEAQKVYSQLASEEK